MMFILDFLISVTIVNFVLFDLRLEKESCFKIPLITT